MIAKLFSALFFAFVGAGVGVLVGIALVLFLGDSIMGPVDAGLLFSDPEQFQEDLKRNIEYGQYIVATVAAIGGLLGLATGWNLMLYSYERVSVTRR